MVKQQLIGELLRWLATSTYYHSGYTRGQQRQYELRWPADSDAGLHGGNMKPQ